MLADLALASFTGSPPFADCAAEKSPPRGPDQRSGYCRTALDHLIGTSNSEETAGLDAALQERD